MNNKILWGILAVLISFDCVYSYIAITQRGMREWNPIAGFFVGINPLYYFFSIPLSLGVFYFIVKALGWYSYKTEKSKKYLVKEFTEKLALTGIVIGWGLVATFYNFWTFANGFVNPPVRYNDYLIAAVLILVSYVLYSAYSFSKKNKIKMVW